MIIVIVRGRIIMVCVCVCVCVVGVGGSWGRNQSCFNGMEKLWKTVALLSKQQSQHNIHTHIHSYAFVSTYQKKTTFFMLYVYIYICLCIHTHISSRLASAELLSTAIGSANENTTERLLRMIYRERERSYNRKGNCQWMDRNWNFHQWKAPKEKLYFECICMYTYILVHIFILIHRYVCMKILLKKSTL